MATLREYTRTNGTTLVRIKVLGDSTGAYAVVVTQRLPNPEYQQLHWRDKSAIPSHTYSQRAVECGDLQSALSLYGGLVAWDMLAYEQRVNRADLLARPIATPKRAVPEVE